MTGVVVVRSAMRFFATLRMTGSEGLRMTGSERFRVRMATVA